MKERDISDVEDCLYKIEALLKEYNCKIEYDSELKAVILRDEDTRKFEQITPCGN